MVHYQTQFSSTIEILQSPKSFRLKTMFIPYSNPTNVLFPTDQILPTRNMIIVLEMCQTEPSITVTPLKSTKKFFHNQPKVCRNLG